MINNVILVGRLTADPEVKEVGESKVINFTLAVPRTYKNEDGEYDADFINCNIWDKGADIMREHCKKGDIVGIKGSLMSSVYEKDDVKHYKLDVRCDRLSLLNPKKVEVTE